VNQANLAGLDGLLDLERRDGVDIRSTLLRVLTDQYVQKPTHTPDDERHYTELALRLIEETDYIARTAVAERLARYPAAPHAIIERLARDIIQVAGPVLQQSPCLTPAELDAIANECGGAHAAVIAARGRAEPVHVEETAAAAAPMRANAQAAELCELFFTANGAERRLILMNLEYATTFAPQLTTSEELTRRLESSALAHNAEGFAREIERALGLSRDQARRVVHDKLGEPIVVVAKALNVPPSVLQRILLFVNPQVGQSVQRVYDLALLYDEITQEAARRLAAIWHDADPPLSRPTSHLHARRREAGEDARAAAHAQERAAAQRDTLQIRRFERPLTGT